MIPVGILLLFLGPGPQEAAPPAQAKCWDTAESQRAMNECAAADWQAADREMNAVYGRLMASGDSVFKDRLQQAQRAWLKFRDSHVESVYPDPEHRMYGSIQPMCSALVLRDLTVERTKQLRQFLEPEEGDACAYPGPDSEAEPPPPPRKKR